MLEADVEAGLGAGLRATWIRDLRTNEVVPAAPLIDAGPACRERFTPARWSGFRGDVDWFREPFEPGRMVGRILGMGDVLGLIARAEETVEQEQAEELARKIRKAEFTLEDFRDQMKQLRAISCGVFVTSTSEGLGFVGCWHSQKILELEFQDPARVGC